MSNNKRESFVFYRSFRESICELPAKDRTEVYDAIFGFVFDGVEPEIGKMGKLAKIVWPLIKPQLVSNIRRYENGCKGGEYGNRGGAPAGNQNARKTTPNTENKQPQNDPKTTPNENENDNVNENDNECVNSAPAPTREVAYLQKQFELLPMWLKQNAASVLEFEEPLTFEQFAKLFKDYGAERFKQCARELHNKRAVETNRNAMTTFSAWLPKINLAR